MLLFLILLLMLALLTIFTVLIISLTGAVGIVLFGDVIVAILIIVWIMKKIICKKKTKKVK